MSYLRYHRAYRIELRGSHSENLSGEDADNTGHHWEQTEAVCIVCFAGCCKSVTLPIQEGKGNDAITVILLVTWLLE